MKVQELMTHPAKSCRAEQTLDAAATLMWEHDVGSIPIVDDQHHPIAMLTDRDICLAALRRNEPLSEIPISFAMSRGVFSCPATHSLAEAERTMRDWQVRRLPVVDSQGVLVGVLSLKDLLLAQADGPIAKLKERLLGADTDTAVAVFHHHRGGLKARQ